MNNDFQGFMDALSALDKRTEKVKDEWDEVNRLLDRKLQMLKDALGIAPMERKEK